MEKKVGGKSVFLCHSTNATNLKSCARLWFGSTLLNSRIMQIENLVGYGLKKKFNSRFYINLKQITFLIFYLRQS